MSEIERLRVLIVGAGRERSELARAVVGLGHEVIVGEIDVNEATPVTTTERPDIAFVARGSSSEPALALISSIARRAACPVIAVLATVDPVYIREAAKRGVFGCVLRDDPAELQGAIEITRHRFNEYHDLQCAFGRRAVIEQAKGILMGRHRINGEMAFQMLSEQSQHSGRKLVDVAQAVVDSHLLLTPASAPEPPGQGPGQPS